MQGVTSLVARVELNKRGVARSNIISGKGRAQKKRGG